MNETQKNLPVNPETQPENQLQPFYQSMLPEIFAELDKLTPEQRSEKIDQLNAILLDEYLEARKAHGMPEADESKAVQAFADNLYSSDWLTSLRDLEQPIGEYPGFSAAVKRALTLTS